MSLDLWMEKICNSYLRMNRFRQMDNKQKLNQKDGTEIIVYLFMRYQIYLQTSSYSCKQYQKLKITIHQAKNMIADNIRVKIQVANDLGLEIKYQIQEGKLIVKAFSLDDKIEYQGQLQPNPYIDFQDIQELIDENKKIKIVTKTPNLLKIKVGATPIQMVEKQKINLQNLSETFEKFMKNQSLMEKQMKQQKEELNKHNDLIIDLKKQIQELKLSQQETDLKSLKFKQRFTEEKSKLQNKIKQNQNEVNQIKQEIKSRIELIKQQPGSYQNIIDELKRKINELKFEFLKTTTTISQQSEQLKQHEMRLEQLTSYLQRKLNFQLSKIRRFELSWQISRYNEPIRSCVWSEQLKSKAITMNNNVVSKTMKTKYFEFCLLNASFSNKLKTKQSWAIKINVKTSTIYLGVCLKNKMLNYNFNSQKINCGGIDHGLYMINSGGNCNSHSQKNFNQVQKSFKFGSGDVIFLEYDPIQCKLRFSKKKAEYFEMSIIPPQNDVYHPFVSLLGQNSSFQLILPQYNNQINE